MTKVLAFDLDGTLAPSKSIVSVEMATVLSRLLDTYEICIISGETFAQFNIQLLDHLDLSEDKLARLHLMPTCGTRYYRYEIGQGWRQAYAEDFTGTQKMQIITALKKGIDAVGLHEERTYGPVIEDRGSQITFSALGQDVVAELGDDGVRLKDSWDPDGEKKRRLCDYVATLLPEYEIRAGGSTSVDITRPGIDKAYGANKLMDLLDIDKEDIVFFGDRLDEAGNDYPVKAASFTTVSVFGPSDTIQQLVPYLSESL